jgi:hypothetical protein
METFVCVIDREAIVAFRAEDADHASAIVNSDDKNARDQLFGLHEVLRENGEPLWSEDANVTARRATEFEHKVWQRKQDALVEEWHMADNPQWIDPSSPGGECVAYLIPVSSIYPDNLEKIGLT